jgi:hypothetical protein
MTKPTSAFNVGTSRLKRTAPLPEVDDTRTGVAYELRECRLHSRRVPTLLDGCVASFQYDGACDPGEAQVLLAAVDDAARAARAMLRAMGAGGYVEEWEDAAAKFDAGGRPRGNPTRGASKPKAAHSKR